MILVPSSRRKSKRSQKVGQLSSNAVRPCTCCTWISLPLSCGSVVVALFAVCAAPTQALEAGFPFQDPTQSSSRQSKEKRAAYSLIRQRSITSAADFRTIFARGACPDRKSRLFAKIFTIKGLMSSVKVHAGIETIGADAWGMHFAFLLH